MTPMNDISAGLARDLDEAEAKAWESLAKYKFMMFGYWAAIWVHQNRVGRFRRPNPWQSLVRQARSQIAAAATLQLGLNGPAADVSITSTPTARNTPAVSDMSKTR